MAAISALLLSAALIASFMCARMLAQLLMVKLRGRELPKAANKARVLEKAQALGSSFTPLARLMHAAREKKRAEEFEREMPEVLRLLCISLESGSSLVMALRYAAENCNEPLAGELRRTVWDLEAGQGFDEALDKLRARTSGSEFAYLAVAMEIQHQSGGSLTGILQSVSAMLKQAAELKDDLRTKTEQGRLSSRIVALIPFVLLAVLSILSPDYLSSFLGSPLGACLFALALLLEAAGVVLVKKALQIDFSVDLEEGV